MCGLLGGRHISGKAIQGNWEDVLGAVAKPRVCGVLARLSEKSDIKGEKQPRRCYPRSFSLFFPFSNQRRFYVSTLIPAFITPATHPIRSAVQNKAQSSIKCQQAKIFTPSRYVLISMVPASVSGASQTLSSLQDPIPPSVDLTPWKRKSRSVQEEHPQ